MHSFRYTTLGAPAHAEFKDKGSRFIAHAYPIGGVEVKTLLDAIYGQHPKARHWCYAWRRGIDGQQFRANDDGEPSGSAGRPILGQIDSAGLTDVLVIVVRYFGGTLLGVPGLIHAYKTASAAALAQGEIVVQDVKKMVRLRCGYPYLSEALRIAKRYGARILVQDLQLDCCLTLSVPLADYADCCEAWRQTRVMDIDDEAANSEK